MAASKSKTASSSSDTREVAVDVASLPGMKVADLRELAKSLGLQLNSRAVKSVLVEEITAVLTRSAAQPTAESAATPKEPKAAENVAEAHDEEAVEDDLDETLATPDEPEDMSEDEEDLDEDLEDDDLDESEDDEVDDEGDDEDDEADSDSEDQSVVITAAGAKPSKGAFVVKDSDDTD